MYNIYIAEKRKKDLEEKEKVRKTFAKYRNKFKSKKINIFINFSNIIYSILSIFYPFIIFQKVKNNNLNISNFRTNSNNV